MSNGLPWWFNGKESVCQCRRHRFNPWVGKIPGTGRSLGQVNGNPLQNPCRGNPMDRGAWQATVHRVTKSWTQLSNWHACIISDNIKCSLRNGELEEWVAERRENFPEEVAFILRPEGWTEVNRVKMDTFLTCLYSHVSESREELREREKKKGQEEREDGERENWKNKVHPSSLQHTLMGSVVSLEKSNKRGHLDWNVGTF